MRKTIAIGTLFIGISACGQSAKPPASETESASPSVSVQASASASVSAAPVSVFASASVAPAPSASASATPEDQCGGTAGPFEAKLRPLVKKCFFEAYAKRPTMTGNVRIVINVDAQGQIRNKLVQDEKDLGKPAVSCIKTALDQNAFDTSGCKSKTVTFAMAFGDAARSH